MKKFLIFLSIFIFSWLSLIFISDNVYALSYTDTFSFDDRDYYIVDFQTKIEYYEKDALTSSNYYYTIFNSNGTNRLNWYDNDGNYDLTDLYLMLYNGSGFAPNTMILDNKLYIDILTISSANPIYFMIKMNNGIWVSPTQTTLYTMKLTFELDYDTYISSYFINGYDINGACVYSSGLFGSHDSNLGIAVSFESDFMNYNEGYKNGFENGKLVSWNDGYDFGFDEGWDDGYNASELDYDEGYNDAKEYYGYLSYGEYISGTDAYNLGGSENTISWNVIFGAWLSTFQILSIELFPGLTLGMIMGFPLILGLLSFIIGVATFNIRAGESYSRTRAKDRDRRRKNKRK